MIQIKDNIYFDETKPYEEQSEEFLMYANDVFANFDFTDMSNLIATSCTWKAERGGLSFIAIRIYTDTKKYFVQEHQFKVEVL